MHDRPLLRPLSPTAVASPRPIAPASAMLALSILALVVAASPLLADPAVTGDSLRDPRETHLADIRQLTFGGENAEAYWSPDGKELIYQATGEYPCDQIFRMPIDDPAAKTLVSTGKGRTTCAYFTYPNAERVLYSSTHLADAACPPKPDFSHGYVWPIYASYELFSAKPDGTDIVRLTDNDTYDAEATVCPLDGSIVFTSTRDGDLDLYRMDADGSNVRRLTDTPGYDGGAFFSADCSHLVWRASRPAEGKELDDYRRLLGQGLIRPGKLELWIGDAEGGEARQITYLDSAAFAPFFHPSGERVLFSTNYGSKSGREFDIWAIDIDGTDLERITFSEGFDGFPMFSPDGKMLAFASNRHQAKDGETNVFVARWVEHALEDKHRDPATASADRFDDAVTWLADDAREGRGVGTDGLTEAAHWLAEQFAELELEGGAEDGFLQAFEVPVRVRAIGATGLEIDGVAIPEQVPGTRPDGQEQVPGTRPDAPDADPEPVRRWSVASFSASGSAEGEIVDLGYGISAAEHGHDDYDGKDVEGKIVLIRRFTPDGAPFDDDDIRRRYSELRYKAWTAREHGAAGVLIVDLPIVSEGDPPDEAPLPKLGVESEGDAGLPVAILTRELAAPLFGGAHQASLHVELEVENAPAHNVVARLDADGDAASSRGAIVVGAHYDHLGYGGRGSLAPDSDAPHNGADDNASGTAALLEIAEDLEQRVEQLGRDIWIVAFSGEESGLRGSTHFTRHPPAGLDLDSVYAMINLDMVGRLRGNTLSVLGSDSAEEWNALIEPLCVDFGLRCALGGDGYGPSDQTPFYAAGIPVLHLFTGTHGEYHKPSDDADLINAAGGARVAALTAEIAARLSNREAPLTYKTVPPPPPQGDARSYGASLGTIPDYAGDGRPGVLLAGTREESPAQKAGMQRGDLLVELAGHEIGDIYDFMFVLRQSKPDETVKAVVLRGEERVEFEVTFGENRRMR